MKNIYIIFLIHVILIIGIIFKATAESPATLENVNAGNSEEEEQALSQEDKDAEELWKKVTEDYGDLSEDEYDALKKDKLKKIDALKAAGGDDKHARHLDPSARRTRASCFVGNQPRRGSRQVSATGGGGPRQLYPRHVP